MSRMTDLRPDGGRYQRSDSGGRERRPDSGGQPARPEGEGAPRWSLWRGRSVRTKVALATAVPVLVLLGATSAFLGRQFSEVYHQQARRSAAAQMLTLAVPVGRALSLQALDRLDGYLTQASAASARSLPLLSIGVLDAHGNLVAHSEPGMYAMDVRKGGAEASTPTLPDDRFREAATDLDHAHWRRHRDNTGRLVLDVSMPAASELRWGTMVARFDLTAVDQSRLEVLRVLLGIALLITFAMALILRAAMLRLVVEPVDELARSAHQITRGHLDTRAWVVRSDEIGRLAMDFNAMADELQSYTESLERKVEERSAEVQRKNTELEKVNAKLHDAVAELERIATTDALTGVFNRRRFGEVLDLEARRAKRRKIPFSLVMIDVDHFKHYNDTNGHQAGDRALQDLASTLGHELRATDVLARYGGEEFVALLLDTPKEGAVQVAETLRTAVVETDFECGATQPGGRVTGSFGVATFPDDAADAHTLIECADKALYLAKAAGRNRVIPWGPEVERAEEELAKASQHRGRGE